MSGQDAASTAPAWVPIACTKLVALLQTTCTNILLLLQKTLYLALTTTKYTAVLLLLLNAGSFPLVWHARVFSSFLEQRLALLWHHITHFYLPKEKKRLALMAWYEAHLRIGVHLFRAEWAYTRHVGGARFRLALATFPSIFRTGGCVALAATHFHFIREIPMLSTYEVRTSIGAWVGKWICRPPRNLKPKSGTKSSTSQYSKSLENGRAGGAGTANSDAVEAAQAHEALLPSLKTPAPPIGAATPLVRNSDSANGINGSHATPELDAVSRALLTRVAQTTEEDGAVLYTIAVSQLCYIQGRISVPPALVLATNGFYAAPSSSFAILSPVVGQSKVTYTMAGGRDVDPPHWPAVRAATASMRELAKLHAGGWREVPVGTRWWENVFAACEGGRRERLVPFEGSEAENKGVLDWRRSGSAGGWKGCRGCR
ncbi:hypothetical protein DFH08DRAFT_806040 [Mycena albidolilacea]|uniref:Uncharacterized protein n=1 Tax=Mycena albidolilacea TaxID=1033008 RepID=A0AAD7A7N2_9AGAR|nr:hypothetical protein DFH08DRAFT_806040 [Mycena albidolilacea]